MRRGGARRILPAAAALLLVPSCGLGARCISGREYLGRPPFTARVLSMERLPLEPRSSYPSAAQPGFRLDLRLESGERLRIVEPDTSLDWEWARAFWRLKPGRTYRFAPTEGKDPVETE